MSCPEAMLGWRERKGVEFGEKEALEDLGCGTKDRDWAVAGALVAGFGGFEDWDDGGCFPNGGDVCSIVRLVEEGGEEVDAGGTKVSELMNG